MSIHKEFDCEYNEGGNLTNTEILEEEVERLTAHLRALEMSQGRSGGEFRFNVFSSLNQLRDHNQAAHKAYVKDWEELLHRLPVDIYPLSLIHWLDQVN